MTHFQRIYHENPAFKYFGRILDLRKLDFRRVKEHFDVKNANFLGLIAKIGYLRSILASRTHLRPMFMNYIMRIVPSGMLEGF